MELIASSGITQDSPAGLQPLWTKLALKPSENSHDDCDLPQECLPQTCQPAGFSDAAESASAGADAEPSTTENQPNPEDVEKDNSGSLTDNRKTSGDKAEAAEVPPNVKLHREGDRRSGISLCIETVALEKAVPQRLDLLLGNTKVQVVCQSQVGLAILCRLRLVTLPYSTPNTTSPRTDSMGVLHRMTSGCALPVF